MLHKCIVMWLSELNFFKIHKVHIASANFSVDCAFWFLWFALGHSLYFGRCLETFLRWICDNATVGHQSGAAENYAGRRGRICD